MQRFKTWTETYEQLSKDEQKHVLEPEKLDVYALAAYMTGRDAESFQILERAHQGYLESEQTQLAARSAFWLGLMLMNAGERSRSGGWMARGERLLDKAPQCAEKGLFLIPTALGRLSSGQVHRAVELFEQAETIGEEFGDADVIALGRLGHGQALIQHGGIAKGVKLLDETMAFIETDEVYPAVKGIVYCAVIETCRKVWDLRRAQEWTSALTRWCDAHPDVVPFRGQCLARRAEIIQFHGDWHKALEEVTGACALLTRPPGEPAAGEAYYRKAELLRLLGNFKEAEDSYREAAKWGRAPQPGLALLRLAQKQAEAAETSIRNILLETKDIKKRAELLPGAVHILIAAKQTREANEAANELCGIAGQFDAPYLYAMSFYCLGAVFLSERNFQPALEHLQKALKFWHTLHLPYESAHTKELKGLVYRELSDKDNSDAELAGAKWIFEQLKAMPDLERINCLLKEERHYNTYGLTLRELQILSRVASGKTNKLIAAEFFISERTVDRHVSNIFNKLRVKSRVEATAFAFRNKILDKIFDKNR